MLSGSNKIDILELTGRRLVSWLEDNGIESYRAGQILRWIYSRQTDSFDMMTDLGKKIRETLSLNFSINRLEKKRIETSHDGTKKYLFKLRDGHFIESVLIPEKNHYTLCISSQVGCAQGCKFCLTSKKGLVRNLTKSEIISQVRDIKNDLGNSGQLTNIVFMGMGEPLANYNNVLNAINTITDSNLGLGFSNRRVTVSTAGLVSKLSALKRDTTVNLAISLNATDNKTRDMLMPINRKYPIEKLIDACKKYHLPRRRSIFFEYILIKGINDSEKDANRLSVLLKLKSVRAKINLIPFNSFKGSDFTRPEESEIIRFQKILQNNNYTTVIRRSKGQDISAACGQLYTKSAE